MGRLVKDEKELAQAIKNNVDYIEVEGGIKDFFYKGERDWKNCMDIVYRMSCNCCCHDCLYGHERGWRY